VDEGDAGGPGTWQEGVRVTVKRLTGLQLYELTVLYDATCHLALEFTRRYHTGIFIITEYYYLHQTNIDLGPSVVTHQLVFVAALTTVTLLILGGVPLLIIRAADHLQRRKNEVNKGDSERSP